MRRNENPRRKHEAEVKNCCINSSFFSYFAAVKWKNIWRRQITGASFPRGYYLAQVKND